MQDLEFRQLVQRVKDASPIETIVGERVRLDKRGSLLAARCPFHDEKTPSFYVDVRRQSWRCYGACADGGDVIKFVERFDGMSFFDALELLAMGAGIDVPRGGASGGAARQEQEDASRPLLEALAEAEGLFRAELRTPEGQAAREYLTSRGLKDETCQRFGLGWSRDGGNPITEHARRASIPRAWLEAGLVRRGERGGGYDFFRSRLMIPIADRLGRTVGFGARVLPGDDRSPAKYVNTSETPVFHKGRLIYGWHLAADAIRRERHVALVEGYTDVMAAHQVGIETVVAVLGTATTDDHARWIRRSGARRVTLVFDGDEAGRRAAKRAVLGLLPTGIELVVASPAEGCDPCDMLLAEGGRDRFESMLAEARPWFDWLVASPVGGVPSSELEPNAIASAVDEVLEMLERVSSPVERDAYLLRLAEAFGLTVESVRAQAAGRRRPARVRSEPVSDIEPNQHAGSAPSDSPGNAALDRAYHHLLGALLADNSLIPAYRNLREGCPSGELARLFDLLLVAYDEDVVDPIDANYLWTCLGADPLRERVSGLVQVADRAESPAILARDQQTWLERRAADADVLQLRGAVLNSSAESSTLKRNFEGGPAVAVEAGAGAVDSSDASPTESSRAASGTAGEEALLRQLHERLRERCLPKRSGASSAPSETTRTESGAAT